jgi:hypothetical protein
LKDVQLGDQLFFTTGNGINHTAIVSDIDKNGNIYITHATVNKNQPGSIITQKLNADGSIPYWNNKFVGTGRPKLTQATETTTNESTKKTPSSSESKVPVAVPQQDTTIYENRKSLEEVIITPRKPDTPSSIIPQ